MLRNRIYMHEMGIVLAVSGLCLLLYFCLSVPSRAQNSPQVVDLGTGADVTVVGMEPGEAVNAPVPGQLVGGMRSIAADVTGDGVDDLIIGLPLADGPHGANAGRVYIIFGQTGLSSGTIRDLAVTSPDIIVHGAAAGDALGFALAAGDVNGDGVKDLIIGAPFADETDRPDVGNAYVLFGGSSLTQRSVRDLADPTTGPDVTAIGWGGSPNPDNDNMMDDRDQAGASLASGDINGDGVDDIIVGAPGLDGPDGKRTNGGAVYVFFGQQDLAGGTVRDAAQGLPAGVNLFIAGRAVGRNIPGVGSVSLGGNLGESVATGDLNGDGVEDIIAGAPQALGPNDNKLSSGEVYGIFGSRNLSSTEATVIDVETSRRNRVSTIHPDFTIFGADPGDAAGSSLAAGNINGDQFDDLIIGAPTASGPENGRIGSGEVYIMLGAAALADRDLAETAADVTIQGANQRDEIGFSIAAGDVNGDRNADLILGTPTANDLENDRNAVGKVNILFGGSSLANRAVRDLAQTDQAPEVVIMGANVADQVGVSVATGDINGDATGDVITASPFAAGLRGQTYVIFGFGF